MFLQNQVLNIKVLNISISFRKTPGALIVCRSGDGRVDPIMRQEVKLDNQK